jgi:hypothetical protein
MRPNRLIVILLLTLAVPAARAERRDASIAVAGALSDLQSVCQLQMDDGLQLLAFTKWPAGKEPESQVVAYRKNEHGVGIVYRQRYAGAYSAKLDVAHDYQRNLAPVVVLFVNYGAAAQKAVVHRIKDGIPSVVQELEGGSLDWIPGKYPFLELLRTGSAAVDPDARYRWNGSEFEICIENAVFPTPASVPQAAGAAEPQR